MLMFNTIQLQYNGNNNISFTSLNKRVLHTIDVALNLTGLSYEVEYKHCRISTQTDSLTICQTLNQVEKKWHIVVRGTGSS